MLGNHVTLNYLDVSEPQPQHYAFAVDDDTFAAAFARITEAGIAYHAEPNGDRPGEIYRRWGGRCVYFPDPDGHNMEILTPPAAVPAP
ncbi:MAG: VOC family protein [Acidimicrobiales bacterium]